MLGPRRSRPSRFVALTLFACGLLGAAACNTNKYANPKYMDPPKSFDPKGAELSFNEKSLKAFNTMSDDERAAHIAKLAAAPGSFKGQGTFQRDEELTEKIDDSKYGKIVAWITVPDPVWLEVKVEYQLFSDTRLISGLAPNTHVEFAGTLLDYVYEDNSKPRRLEVKLKADSIIVLKD